MRSDPLRNITKPVGPTPQSGFYLQERVERKSTTIELHTMQRLAEIRAVACLGLTILAGLATIAQGLWLPGSLVGGAFLLAAVGMFAYSRNLRRRRLRASDGA